MHAPSDSAPKLLRLTGITMSGFLCLLLMACISLADYIPSNKIFTYQGRLFDNGAPADGEYDLVFHLLDNPEPNKANPLTWQ